MSYGIRIGALAMALHATAWGVAADAPAPTPPTTTLSSITLQPYASRAFHETGNNRIAFTADGSSFTAPMGGGTIGVFTIVSDSESLNEKDIKRYEELVPLLDEEDFNRRSMATEALKAMGTPILPLIQESLRKTESPELRTRLTELLRLGSQRIASQRIQTVHIKKVLQAVVRSVRYSPNGEQLLVAGYEDSIKLLGARDLQEVRSIPAMGNVTDALFLNKGERLAASIKDKVQFWSTQTGEQMPSSLTHTGSICCIDASPDERWLAVSGGPKGVSTWDLKTHKRVHLLEEAGGSVGHVEFSPDGKYLACACENGNVSVWDVPAFRLRHTLQGHKGSVYYVMFSRDSRWLASTGKDGDVIIWDPEKGERLATNDDRDKPCTPMFSPDGKYLLTLESDKIRLWHIKRAREDGQPAAKPQQGQPK